ncbi:hypothetical protein BDV28DRAFT_162506 [Aspergillus coremiiformis]|uniref:F-box domain-containing protein n=1 Tax=Aspergillus coremiiformis TaxID=138285 RepID=A0A5N6ZEY3_9EURO|nr:hypothetical protein BDV28DRAFT_162506 [Aspergillus coremiiformis]
MPAVDRKELNNMEALDDRDIRAAQALIALAETARTQSPHRGQPSIAPRRGSRQESLVVIDPPRGDQSTGDSTTSIQSPGLTSTQSAGRSSFAPRPMSAQTSMRSRAGPSKALQDYLLRQQLLAGIAPENMIGVRDTRPGHSQEGVVNNPNNPSLVQITNDGIVIPYIPPAQFTGVLHPLPVRPTQISPAPVPLPRGQPVPRRGSNAAVGLRTQSASEIRTDASRGRVPVSREGSTGLSRRQSRPHATDSTHQGAEGGRTQNTEARPSGQRNDRYAPSDQQDRPQPRIQLFPTLSRGSISPMPLNSAAVPQGTGNEASMTATPPHNGFDIILAFTYHQSLALEFTTYLDVRDLITLFSISKTFNQFVKRRCSDIIKRQAMQKAPESAWIFPFRCYPSLCINNRNARQRLVPAGRIGGENNLTPSFRWLQMIIYRETTVRNIMSRMARANHGLPIECGSAIKKIWFLMDIPDNKRRIWTVENRNLWENIDILSGLYFLTQFSLLSNNQLSVVSGRLYRLLMAQPTLTMLWDVVNGTAIRHELDALKAFVRWAYTPLPHERDLDVYGVPARDVGALKYEGYGRNERTVMFYRPDMLMLHEMARRNLEASYMYSHTSTQSNSAPYHSRATRAMALWDEEMRREANAHRADWQTWVSLE